MPSDVAWRFFLASAAFTQRQRNHHATMKKPSGKKATQPRKKTSITKQHAKSKHKVFKKPSAKASATEKKKAKPKDQLLAGSPKTPKRRTTPLDGTTPWREHFPQ